MYPPPPPPPLPPARQRHGVPALGVILIGLGCLLAGCVGGAAIASSPDPGTPAAASSSTDPSPSTSTTSARPTVSTTRTPDGRRRTRPAPKRTTAKPRPKPRTRTRAPSTDPRYSTCTEARRHGLGPYRRGQAEYDWYQDRDGDGVVCES